MDDLLHLEVAITVRQRNGGHLQIREDLQLQPRSFLEVCKVLGEFSQLAERIRLESKP